MSAPNAADPAKAAPQFWECPSCGYISRDPSFADAKTLCPLCQTPDGLRRPFPPDRQRQLDARIRGYFAEGEWAIVVMLSAALMEALLEDILDRIMAAHGADVPIRSTVLDQVRAVGARIGKLFPELTGEEFEDATAEAGKGDFSKRWRKLREMRNAFIHDTPYRDVQAEMDRAAAAEGMALLDSAYDLFVHLNNRFVADGLRGKRRATDGATALHGVPEREQTGDAGDSGA
jgi:hypothetical protein